MDGLEHMVDHAVSPENGIDFVLVSGDLFDSVRPGFGTVADTLRQILRLADAGVHVYIIGGNHDTPKTTTGTSPLDVLSYMPNVTVAYREFKHVTDMPWNVNIHMVPFTPDRETFEGYIERSLDALDKDFINILMLHVSAGDEFIMNTYNELVLSHDELAEVAAKYDYVALGHYHGMQRLDDERVVYPGSLERMSFNEASDMDKGFIVGELDIETNLVTRLDWVTIPTRPMFEMAGLDYNDMPAGARPTDWLLEHIQQYTDRMDGSICRLAVDNVPALVYRALDFRAIREAASKSLHFDCKFSIKEEHVEYNIERVSFRAIPDEWAEFMAGQGLADAEDIERLGIEHIKKVV